MKFFKVPSQLMFGWGSIEYLKQLKGKRAFIVTDKIIEEIGFASKVEAYLKEAGFEAVEVFSDTEPDPSRTSIEKGVEAIKKFKADWIVGLGGGSAIDSAKSIWVFYEHPEAKWEDVLAPNQVPPLGNKAKFCTIATTSGTGSEVTIAAVVTNRGVEPHVKDVLFSPELCADVAIADPEFASTMPQKVTADTGLDVLTHAIEAYTSIIASEVDKALALHAIKLTFRSLRKSFADGRNMQSREDMHTASFMAGAAFSHSSLGCVHGTAHQLGSQFGIPHGRANSIMLPYVIQYNSVAVSDLYAEIAKTIDLEFSSNKEAVNKLIEAIRDLKKDVNLPNTIEEAGIDEKLFFDQLEAISINSVHDVTVPTNPRVPSQKDMEIVYTAAYYGKDLI